MILKHPMRFPLLQTIENIFLACCVLHNLLCDYDGRDDWRTRLELQELDSVESDVDEDGEEYRQRSLARGRRNNPLERVGLTRHIRRQLAIQNASDERALRFEEPDGDNDGTTITMSALGEYKQRRDLLVDHFKVASDKGELSWFGFSSAGIVLVAIEGV